MANGETYPKIGRKMWWLLRDRLKKSVPSTITSTLITSLSPMADASARANVISPLRALGLVDDADKPTELAEHWRHDDDYAAVCHEIRQKCYPHELIEAFPQPTSAQRDLVKKWFMRVGQVGEGAAGKFADTYMLLSEADLSRASEKPTSDPARKSAGAAGKAKPRQPIARLADSAAATPAVPLPSSLPHPPTELPQKRLPTVHIDVQVHISPDSSPDQIDRIFESMAKHLGGYVK